MVSNDGHGGCNVYRPGAKGYQGVREYLTYADQWGEAHGIRFEPADALVGELIDTWRGGQPIYE